MSPWVRWAGAAAAAYLVSHFAHAGLAGEVEHLLVLRGQLFGVVAVGAVSVMLKLGAE